MHDPLHRTFSAPCFIPFCSYWYASPRDLHSFPTRRSSDLGVLLSLQGGSDMGLFEINEAARLVQEAAHPEANIIFGAVIDDTLGDEVRVTVIAAGFDSGSPTQVTRKESRAIGQIYSDNSAKSDS